MRVSQLRLCGLGALGVLALVVCSATASARIIECAAEPPDIAEHLPTDTVVYVGWNNLLQRDDSAVRLATQWLRAAARVDEKDTRLAAIDKAVDAVTLALESPGGIGVLDAGFKDGQFSVEAMMIVAAGTKSGSLDDAVTACFHALWPVKLKMTTSGANSIFSTQIGDSPLLLVWGEADGQFRLGVGTSETDIRVSFDVPAQEPLSRKPTFVNGRKQTRRSAGEWNLDAFVNLPRAIALIEPIIARAGARPPSTASSIATAIGAESLRAWYLHAGPDDRGTAIRSVLLIDNDNRLLPSLFRGSPVTDEDLQLIPRDVFWARVWNMDLAACWKASVDAVDPNAMMPVTAALAASQLMLGFSLVDDLLPAIGDTWELYDAPAHGGIMLSGTILTVEVRDREKLMGVVNRLAEWLPGVVKRLYPEATPQVLKTQIGMQTVRFLALGGVPSPIAPAWGFAADRLVIGLTPQSVAAAMRQIDPTSRRASLLDDDVFKGIWQKNSRPPAMSVQYTDTRATAQSLYPIALHYATALSNMASLPSGPGPGDAKVVSSPASRPAGVDFAAFPTYLDALSGARPIIGMAIASDDGVLYEQTGSGPTFISVAAMGAIASTVLLPAMEIAREQSVRVANAAQLDQISRAVAAYREDHNGRWPASFDALVEVGLLTRESLRSLRSPEEEHPFVFVAGAGAVTRDADTVVLAYEKPVDEEGTNVLMADLRVHWLATGDFRRKLTETYRALGREKELPPTLRP